MLKYFCSVVQLVGSVEYIDCITAGFGYDTKLYDSEVLVKDL